ncbi:MAG: hypothetical protein JRI22_11545, partial [Deltaproteobacteria bacterium]|nr:hypothetical protein [Deltaproteobacteria bacterium]
MSPRDLSGNMLLSIRKKSRLSKSSTRGDPAGQSPTMRLGKGMAMPEKLSRLRRKPGQKAKQEPKFRFYSIPHDKLMACL